LGGVTLLVAALFWLVVFLRKRQPVVDEQPPSPFQTACDQLASLQQTPPHDREQLRHNHTKLLQILRQYLAQRLDAPFNDLTAREICRYLDPTPPTPPRLQQALGTTPLPWSPQLQEFLVQSEPICYGPPTNEPIQPQHFVNLTTQTRQLLDQIEAWQRQREHTAQEEQV
jgi:hypothetical protein